MNDLQFSVTELNNYIKYSIDNNEILSALAVYGEVYNYKTYPSGHAYFSLRDENCSLKCVLFSSCRRSVAFNPVNGMKVLAFCRVSVYPKDGVYQLYCSGMLEFGTGNLQIAFDKLKKKLNSEGLFDQSHKKALPKMPGKIVVITSPAGAAVHDIITILSRRWPLSEVLIFPVKVQGDGSAEEIAEAIRLVNRIKLGDVIITGRGGGSIEDLWSFNTETVARAIYDSEIPVISAVGHEPDVTISDYTADLRASTPSNAAELCVPDCADVTFEIESCYQRLNSSVLNIINSFKNELKVLSQNRYLSDPLYYFESKISELDIVEEQLIDIIENRINRYNEKLSLISASLEALSPLKILSRGYAIAADMQGHTVFSVSDIKKDDSLSVMLRDGQLFCKVEEITISE